MPIPEDVATPSHPEGEPGTGPGSLREILWRWRRDGLVRKGSLVLRGLALMFSLLAFIVMASNKHGGWKDFYHYKEFRYLLAISILSTLYTGAQAFRHVHEISTGKELFQKRTSALIDFAGDQVATYLLVRAASTAVPMTNRMRDNIKNLFTESLVASICMAFFSAYFRIHANDRVLHLADGTFGDPYSSLCFALGSSSICKVLGKHLVNQSLTAVDSSRVITTTFEVCNLSSTGNKRKELLGKEGGAKQFLFKSYRTFFRRGNNSQTAAETTTEP